MRRRPDRRLGRSIDVPDGRAGGQEPLCEVGRKGLASTEDAQGPGTAPPCLQQHPPRRGSRLHDRRVALGEEGHQLRRVGRDFPARDDYLCAGHERKEQLEARDIEGQRCHRDEHVSVAHVHGLLETAQHIGERTVGDLHTFRAPRRAGRVDDVGEVFKVGATVRLFIRLRCDGARIPIQTEHTRRDRHRDQPE